MRPPIPLLLLVFALSACASGGAAGGAGAYVGGQVALECAPFARALSGLRLSGPAADWWWAAAGRYDRTSQPETGSVLVFQRSERLRSGHVAVVSRVLSRRQILVTQANWVHHRVTEDQPVTDISSGNDWSLVRVWWPPGGTMGATAYPAFGFISPAAPTSHDRLVAATPRAIRIAAGQ